MKSEQWEVSSGDFWIKTIYLLSLLLTCYFLLPTCSYADSSIRVLLLDGKNSKIPQKGEKIEKLGNAKGEVLLSGLKYSGVIEVWKGRHSE